MRRKESRGTLDHFVKVSELEIDVLRVIGAINRTLGESPRGRSLSQSSVAPYVILYPDITGLLLECYKAAGIC